MEQLIMAVVTLAVVLAVRRQEAFVVRWLPCRGTWVAIGTGLLAFALSGAILLVGVDSLWARIFHYGGIYVLCGAVIPLAYTRLIARQPLRALGIRRTGAATSVAISACLAAIFSLIIVFQADLTTLTAKNVAKGIVVLAGAGGLFEVLLYYAFIHQRLEEAFGTLPAIFVASALYVTWHTGTQLPLEPDLMTGIVKLFAVGVTYQAIFALTHNVLIIWPLFHAAGVMIDFTVNLDAIGTVTKRFPWALAAIIAMCATALTVEWAAQRSTPEGRMNHAQQTVKQANP